jgi:membrane associated rhomboid family serine protease
VVLPIGDAPNPRGAPVVTYLLIAANVAVFLLVTLPLSAQRPASNDPAVQEYLRAMAESLHNRGQLDQLIAQLSVYDLVVFNWGFRPAAPSVVDLFTCMFLHGGFLHLFGNMLFLWIYGDNVEHRLGRLRFLLWYLGTGVAATLFHTLRAAGSEIPLVGASGAISGVLGFYFIWFPRNQVRLLWLLPPFLMQTFDVPARLVLGVYLVLDNLLPYLVTSGESGVAHGAHIGGFLAGLVAAWVMDRREVAARPVEFADAPRVSLRQEPGFASRITEAIDAGRMEEAAVEYFEVPAHASRGLLTSERSLALARWLVDNGHHAAAVAVARRHLRDYPNGPGVAEAQLIAGEAQLASGQPTPAYQYVLAALDADPDASIAAAARRGIATIESLQKRQVGHPHARRRA